MSLGGWFVTSREQPVVADVHIYCWEPGGTFSLVGSSQECTPDRCRDFAPKVDPDWTNRLSDLMNRFSLLCADGGNEVTCDVFLGLFNRALSDMGILGIAGVHFDVSGGGLVPAGSHLLVSVDTGDGDRFPVTTTTCSLTGDSECCGWLQFMTRGGGGVCGSSNWYASMHRQLRRRGGMYLDCVHSAGIRYSSAGDRVTASPNSLMLLDCRVCSFVLML